MEIREFLLASFAAASSIDSRFDRRGSCCGGRKSTSGPEITHSTNLHGRRLFSYRFQLHFHTQSAHTQIASSRSRAMLWRFVKGNKNFKDFLSKHLSVGE